MKNFFKMMKDTKGATAIEYGLIAALIAVAAIVSMRALGGEVSETFVQVESEMNDREEIAAD